MRVTTANQFNQTVASLQRRAQELQATQVQLSTGKKVARASDDPAGAARIERALAAIGKVDANQRALDASRNSMNLAESAIGDASELLQQVREALVAAGNASYSDPERFGLADKIAGLRKQLLAIANRPDGSGGYVFSGQGASQPPFLDEATGVRFNGVPGSQFSGTLEDFALTVDGRLTWEQGRSGNGFFVTGPLANVLTNAPVTGSWIDAGRVTDPNLLTNNRYQIVIEGTEGIAQARVTNLDTGGEQIVSFEQGRTIRFDGLAVNISGTFTEGDAFSIDPASNDLNIFRVLDDAVANLRAPNRTGAQVQQANVQALRDVDAGFQNLQSVRSLVGERLNLLDGSENRLGGLKLYNQTERSAAEDLDMTEAISRFQIQQTSYEAALRSYAAVQRLNLFEFLSF
ncbi:MAG: flagellar hook-associated protein FlgL [Burkholderiales bacterium]|nr:flagellar hook-associated protein FlgL [Burkholderiales bacterium]